LSVLEKNTSKEHFQSLETTFEIIKNLRKKLKVKTLTHKDIYIFQNMQKLDFIKVGLQNIKSHQTRATLIPNPLYERVPGFRSAYP
jgi:hypothetical protein